MMHRRFLILSCSIALSFAACAPEIDQDPRPERRVQVVFDPNPAAPTIPLPNNAALEQDGTLPNLGREAEGAQKEFYDLLDTLHGWLPSSPISIPFDGELDPESVTPEAIKLVSLSADGALIAELELEAVTYSDADPPGPARSVIEIKPATPLAYGARYGVVATNAIKGANGIPVGAPAAIFFALNDGPIFDAQTGRSSIPQLDADEDSRAQAAQIEASLRPSLAPIVENLDELGLENRDQIAAAFTWTTATDALAILEPDAGIVPLPNTAAMDREEDGSLTFPVAGLDALSAYQAELAAFEEARREGRTDVERPERDARIYFEEYLDSLHGWPNDTASLPITLTLSAAPDPTTINSETAQLWKLGEDGTLERVDPAKVAIEVTSDEEGRPIIAMTTPEELLDLNQSYVALVTREATDTKGRPLRPDPALLLTLQPHPIVEPSEGGELVSTVAEIDDKRALSAAGVQQLQRPAIEALKAEGIEWDELAALWTWYTWRDPFFVFDLAAGDIPFPNAFLRRGEPKVPGGPATVSLPTAGITDPLQLALLNELNTRTGFSPLGAGWYTVLGELDPATLTVYESRQVPGSIAMTTVAGMTPTGFIGRDQLTLDFRDELDKLFFRFETPLAKATQHIALVSDRVKGTNGLSAKPTPIFVMLSSPDPLTDEGGASLIPQLPDELAPALEEARQLYAPLFSAASLIGDSRETIIGAFSFTTDDYTRPLQERRAQVIAKLSERATLEAERGCETDEQRACAGDLQSNELGALDAYSGPYAPGGVSIDLSNVGQIQWAGEFRSVDFRPNGESELVSYQMASEGEGARVPLSLFVPKIIEGECEPPFRVVIAQHGLGSTRLVGALSVANALAAPERCMATVALDAPLHGGRAAGGTTLHPEQNPLSGDPGFIGLDFVRTKANFAQSVLDLVALTSIIEAGGLEGLVEAPVGIDRMFAAEPIGALGISLGGIMVTDLTTIDPRVNAAVLNVAPGKLTYYVLEPSAIGAGLLGALELIGFQPGSFGFERLISFAQWLLDPIDPAAMARYAGRTETQTAAGPAPGPTLDVLRFDPGSNAYSVVENPDALSEVPALLALVQMAQGDAVAPNRSTEQLARILGIDSLAPTTFSAAHGFLAEFDEAAADATAARCGRCQAAYFLDAALDALNEAPSASEPLAPIELPAELYAEACVASPPPFCDE